MERGNFDELRSSRCSSVNHEPMFYDLLVRQQCIDRTTSSFSAAELAGEEHVCEDTQRRRLYGL